MADKNLLQQLIDEKAAIESLQGVSPNVAPKAPEIGLKIGLDALTKEERDDLAAYNAAIPESEVKRTPTQEHRISLEAQREILNAKAKEIPKQKQEFDNEVDLELKKRAAASLLNNDKYKSLLNGITPKDMLTNSVQDASALNKGGVEGLNQYIDNYVQSNRQHLLDELEKKKQKNLEHLANSMSDEEFKKKYDVEGTLQKVASQFENPAKWLKGEKGQEALDFNNSFFNGHAKKEDFVLEDGRINPEYKKQVLSGALNNPYDLYYESPQEIKTKDGKTVTDLPRLPMNHNVGLSVANGLTEKAILDNKVAKNDWTKFMEGLDQYVDSDINPLSPSIGAKQALEHTESFIKGAAKIGAFGAALLESPFTNQSFGENLNEKVQDINAVIPAKHKEYGNMFGRAVDQLNNMYAEYGAGGGLTKIGLGKLVEPFATKGLDKLYGQVRGAASELASGATTSTLNSTSNKILAYTMKTMQKLPAESAAKLVDNFSGMLTTGGAQMYADAYEQSRKAGYSPEESQKRATNSTLITSLFFSAAGVPFKGANPEERNIVDDIFGGQAKKGEVKPIAYLKNKWNKLNENGLGKLATRTTKNIAKGAGEFTAFNAYENIKAQKEQFDKAKEQGLIPEDSKFSINFDKPTEDGEVPSLKSSLGEGGFNGMLLGVVSTINGHGIAPSDPNAEAMAASLENPERYERQKATAIARGQVSNDNAQMVDGFRKAIKPFYDANIATNQYDKATSVKLAIEQARLVDAQRQYNTLKSIDHDPKELAKVQDLIDKSQQTITQLKSGTYLKGAPITSREMKELTKGTLRGKQAEEITKNAPYTIESVNLDEYKNDEDVKKYIELNSRKDDVQNYIDERDNIQKEIDKYKGKQSLGIKLSSDEQKTLNGLEFELEDLNKRHSPIKSHMDIIGFNDPTKLAPIIDADGNIIDGKKRIAKAIIDGQTHIDVARPMKTEELQQIHEDAQHDTVLAPEVKLDEGEVMTVDLAKDAFDKDGIQGASDFLKENTENKQQHDKLLKAVDGSITQAMADAAWNEKFPKAEVVETPTETIVAGESQPKPLQETTESQDVTLQAEPQAEKQTVKDWIDEKVKEDGMNEYRAKREMLDDDVILDGIMKKLNLKEPNKYKKVC